MNTRKESQTNAQSAQAFNRDLALIFLSNGLGSFGDGLYSYILPVHMAKTLGTTSTEIGILYAIVNLFAASSLLISGFLADRYDPKIVMILGWSLWVPAPLIFASATNLVQMMFGMIFWGFWFGGPSVTSYILRSASKNTVTFALTLVSAGWSLGYIVSPALGGYLASIAGMQLVFFSASALYATAGLVLCFITGQRPTENVSNDLEHRYSFLQLVREKRMLRISALFASIMFTVMMCRPFIARFLVDMYDYDSVRIGVLGSALFLGASLLGVILGKIGDRGRKPRALATALALCGFSLVILLFSGNFVILAFALFFTGCSYTLWSLMNAIIGPLGPESSKASWVSIPQSVSMFGAVVAPFVGGLLYDISPRYPFILATGAFLIISWIVRGKLLENID